MRTTLTLDDDVADARDEAAPRHTAALAWFERTLSGTDEFGVSPSVTRATARLVSAFC